ncbi:hypothetical protein ACFPYI_14960 [Halomarina salina]|uniref:DUF4321 domain-containing protein n=1 Tax=Halomarina salina TaxID=1872699 RepID=A0ABD5RQ33_9EURY|nr:hypothetical protein [Halomarina salina]
MSQQTLTALSQRDEAFWIALGLLFGGAVLTAVGTGLTAPPSTIVVDIGPVLDSSPTTIVVDIGTLIADVGRFLSGVGTLVILTRIAVAVWRILRTTVLAGRLGYAEGVAGDAPDADHGAADEDRTTLTE